MILLASIPNYIIAIIHMTVAVTIVTLVWLVVMMHKYQAKIDRVVNLQERNYNTVNEITKRLGDNYTVLVNLIDDNGGSEVSIDDDVALTADDDIFIKEISEDTCIEAPVVDNEDNCDK